MRREKGLYVLGRIHLTIETTDRVKKAFEVHGNHIKEEVLALSVTFAPCEGEEKELNGEVTTIAIERAQEKSHLV